MEEEEGGRVSRNAPAGLSSGGRGWRQQSAQSLSQELLEAAHSGEDLDVVSSNFTGQSDSGGVGLCRVGLCMFGLCRVGLGRIGSSRAG